MEIPTDTVIHASICIAHLRECTYKSIEIERLVPELMAECMTCWNIFWCSTEEVEYIGDMRFLDDDACTIDIIDHPPQIPS